MSEGHKVEIRKGKKSNYIHFYVFLPQSILISTSKTLDYQKTTSPDPQNSKKQNHTKSLVFQTQMKST